MGLAPPTEIVGIRSAESEEEVSFHPILLRHQLFEYPCEDVLFKWIVLGLLNIDLGIPACAFLYREDRVSHFDYMLRRTLDEFFCLCCV